MKAFLFSIFILALILSFSYSGLVLAADSKVLEFTFDGNTVQGKIVSDVSGNKNDGELMGGAKVANGVVEFDGKDSYIGSPALDVRNGAFKSFTAIARFRTDSPENGPLWMWGDNAAPSSSTGAEGPVGWRSSTKKFAAGFYGNAHFYADAKEDYADNNWHVVAQVGDENIGYLYVDGERISETTAGYIYTANPYFLLGARTKNSGNEIDDIEYFKGFIDYIAIYNYALSLNDIKKITAQVSSVLPAGKLTTNWGYVKDKNGN